jgi:hypothetical protein
MRLLLALLLVLAVTGCTTQRTVTISTKPADAFIKVNGVERGRAPITETFLFAEAGQTHRVVASRPGYKDATWNVGADFNKKTHHIELLPLTRRVTINVIPEPAVIKINGKPVDSEPVTTFTDPEMEFTQGALGDWNVYEVTAERPGFQTARRTISWPDRESTYTLELLPVEKDLRVVSDPPGAEIYLDDEKLGVAPVETKATQFRVDPDRQQLIPRTLRALKPGYDPVEQPIAWDGGQKEYRLVLKPKRKVVRVTTDPPATTLKLEGIDDFAATTDAEGVAGIELTFPPINEQGDLRKFTLHASKKTEDREWYPASIPIAWDEGRTDYNIKLKEILTRPVPLMTLSMRRDNGNWSIVADRIETIAMKDTAETGNARLERIYAAADGEFIDGLAISPDGQRIAIAVLAGDTMPLRSQIRSIAASGTGGERQHTDGSALELMPAYTPDGQQIVFSSDRMSRTMSVCSVRADGTGGITEITRGNDSFDLWPAVDSDPQQRVYYTRYMEKRDAPRLYWQQMSGANRTDLTNRDGTQPRPSPKADAIVFTSENGGKRDIFRLPERGTPENLTNTRDADETQPIYSRDGSKILFVSDIARHPETGPNRDLWMLDLSKPDQPHQLTTNGSWDDSPVWDPAGNAVYFRSNRGGQWGIWKLSFDR